MRSYHQEYLKNVSSVPVIDKKETSYLRSNLQIQISKKFLGSKKNEVQIRVPI
jgi:hypothetical protein